MLRLCYNHKMTKLHETPTILYPLPDGYNGVNDDGDVVPLDGTDPAFTVFTQTDIEAAVAEELRRRAERLAAALETKRRRMWADELPSDDNRSLYKPYDRHVESTQPKHPKKKRRGYTTEAQRNARAHEAKARKDRWGR
jgi:hypothetical protein